MTPAPEDRQKLLMDTHLEGHRGAQAIVTALHSDGIHWTKLKEDALETIREYVKDTMQGDSGPGSCPT
ncbi:hypothetical protein G6F62_015675 [Rhizopus arrhizus]|nr:hypothetical protein G6F62_015675 [Rhizopus arrhizus]